jgi:hypothetical protein
MWRILIIVGVISLVLGGLLYLFERFGLNLGRLPGDIRVEGQHGSCVLALGTSILLSILLTLGLNLLVRLLNR